MVECVSMLYFAYGSNMNLPHLQDWLRRFGVEPEGVSDPQRAALHNYRLRTNYHSTAHDAGACNIEPARGTVVEGVAMRITSDVLRALNIKEGHPHRYIDLEVAIQVEGASAPITAVTFVVHPELRLDYDVPVTQRYRDLILVGAQDAGLSPGYQKQLQHVLKTALETPISSDGDDNMGTCLLGRSPGNPSML